MKKMVQKKGQIHLSFGMIFSIIMIIVFIAFAFYAIQKFIGLQKDIQTSQFYDTLQKDINTVWNSAQSTQQESYTVPDSIGKICFIQPQQGDDMIIYDKSGKPTGSQNIENIDLTEITASNQSCFNNVNGKISLVLKKTFSDTLVVVGR